MVEGLAATMVTPRLLAAGLLGAVVVGALGNEVEGCGGGVGVAGLRGGAFRGGSPLSGLSLCQE